LNISSSNRKKRKRALGSFKRGEKMPGRANGHLTYLTQTEIGSVTITPVDKIVAGSFGCWTLTYTVGLYGLDVGGGIKIGNRRMSDWGTPQFHDPKAPNYVTVSCSSPAELSVRYDPRGYIRPFRAVIAVDLEKGALSPGDRLVVVMGDQSGGSPGRQAQSFPEKECVFAVFVDALSSGLYQRVPQVSPPLQVVTGEAKTFVLQGPSEVLADRPFRVKVHGSDQYGNPTPTDAGGLSIKGADAEIQFHLDSKEGRVRWIEDIRISKPGVYYLQLCRGDECLARSNPIRVSDQKPLFHLYWGDTQAQTASTVGTGTVEEYFQYARDVAGIDFCTHQANDFILQDADWDEVVQQTKRFYEPGRFASILGYEWSGTTGAGGDRNALFEGDEAPLYRSSSWQVAKGSPETERPTAESFHDAIRRYKAQSGWRVVLIPHVGGRKARIDSIDPGLEPVLEICSCHGIFEWFLQDALARGYRIGVIAASDDHTCRPGLAFPSTPEMAIRGGLAAVYADDLTRAGIIDALYARRCYGTTGERIIVHVEADGHPMGSEFTARHGPDIHVLACGTAPIEQITIYDKEREIFVFVPNPLKRDERRIRLLWSGARGRDRNRYTIWNGRLSLSGGRILSATPLNMYLAKEGITGWGSGHVSWRSITAGHESGILMEVDAPDETEIKFETAPANFSFRLGQIRNHDLRVEAEGVSQAVHVSTQHTTGDIRQAEFHFKDEGNCHGSHAYWVKVVQRDFHRAWTSPIYVDIV
jgi:hypothetical protein